MVASLDGVLLSFQDSKKKIPKFLHPSHPMLPSLQRIAPTTLMSEQGFRVCYRKGVGSCIEKGHLRQGDTIPPEKNVRRVKSSI